MNLRTASPERIDTAAFNDYTDYQPYQLWIYRDSEFRLTATAELKKVAFNDIKSVHKI